MTISEFNEEIIKAMVAFQDYWNRGHEKLPEQFPKDLDEEQWWEQFTIWTQDWEELRG